MPRLRVGVNLAAHLRSLARRDGPGRHWQPVELLPERGVARLSPTAFEAQAGEAWLTVRFPGPVPAGNWIRLRYGAGLLGDPVRPLLRVHRRAGLAIDIPLPGPVCGWAVWTGRLPEDCVGLSVSPVAAPGPFALAVEGVVRLSRLRLLAGAALSEPGPTLGAVRQWLFGRRVRARHALAAIWSATPLAAYDGWRRAREAGSRLPEPWAESQPGLATIVVDARRAEAGVLERTLASLRGQIDGPVPAIVVGPGGPGPADAGATWSPTPAQALREVATPWVGAVTAGDQLAPTTLAALAAAVRRRPDADLIYSDEDRMNDAGRRLSPRLKPDWSLRLQAASPYIGGLALVRTADATLRGGEPDDIGSDLVAATLAVPRQPSVVHVRRILLTRPVEKQMPPAARPSPQPAGAADAPASVAVVIPNRDRLALLQPCIEGLLGRTAYPDLTVMVVDNGSQDPATYAFYRSLSADPRVSVLDRPGPFNFSALTNAGVASTRSELVLLLNNDIEVTHPEWLSRLAAEVAPDVGAVGARLLYPSGRSQHEGVVIGLGGGAGHIWRNRQVAGPGDDTRRSSPHEVSAVTGACLLVARDKYVAVGGLDEERFPVSYNDIDFCLKLRQQGWRNILVPDALLTHHESASRGRDEQGEKQRRADREAAFFAAAWGDAIRDDPYFHPGLSLMRFEPSLG